MICYWDNENLNPTENLSEMSALSEEQGENCGYSVSYNDKRSANGYGCKKKNIFPYKILMIKKEKLPLNAVIFNHESNQIITIDKIVSITKGNDCWTLELERKRSKEYTCGDWVKYSFMVDTLIEFTTADVVIINIKEKEN